MPACPSLADDVYVSVVGGLQVRDPGADLPVAIALASSLLDRGVGAVAAWGEVGLTGEVRAVAHGEHRAAEAKRLGIDTGHRAPRQRPTIASRPCSPSRCGSMPSGLAESVGLRGEPARRNR